MYEHLASFLSGPPNNSIIALYEVWAHGGWGMVISGNVQVSRKHLSLGADMIVPDTLSEDNLKGFKRLARSMKGGIGMSADGNADESSMRPLAIMQLNHTGRQSPNVLGGRLPFIQPPLSASATRVGAPSHSSRRSNNLLTRIVNALLFQRAHAMSEKDVEETVDSFVRGALLAVRSGFDGIQIHGAHGCML